MMGEAGKSKRRRSLCCVADGYFFNLEPQRYLKVKALVSASVIMRIQITEAGTLTKGEPQNKREMKGQIYIYIRKKERERGELNEEEERTMRERSLKSNVCEGCCVSFGH